MKNRNILLILVFLFLFLHGFLFNFNIAEWGDSYNILNAAEALKEFKYPVTEKRLPLLPGLIALGSLFLESLTFAKFITLFLSLASFILISFLYRRLFPQSKGVNITLIMLLFNPLFLYWSIRVMTDVVLVFFVLLAFYLYFRNFTVSLKDCIWLGIVLGLAAMTRYEGFFLVPAILIPLLIKRHIKRCVLVSVPFIIIIFPYFIRNIIVFGNPVFTGYAKEAGGYAPDLRLILIFLSYLIFLTGGLLTPYFAFQGFRRVLKDWKRFLPILIFTALMIPLIAYWTAAVPRLFVSIIPICVTFFTIGFSTDTSFSSRLKVFTINVIAFFVFALFGFILKPHFLMGSFGASIIVLFLSAFALFILLIYSFNKISLYKVRSGLLAVIVLSNMVVSVSVLYRGKYIFSTTAEAAQFAADLEGPVGFADETGTTAWYLRKNGLYWNDDPGFVEALIWMRERGIKYVVTTNEHYDEGANFLVVYDGEELDKFKLVKRFERKEVVDPFNNIFQSIGLVKSKEYSTKFSEVYEVVKYRED